MEEFNTEKLGARVKELRLKMGLTQNQVAQALHVTPGYISNVENNRTAMSLRILTYYAKLCGITLDSLVGRIDPEYEKSALDNELLERLAKLDSLQKKKLLRTLEIWEMDEI